MLPQVHIQTCSHAAAQPNTPNFKIDSPTGQGLLRFVLTFYPHGLYGPSSGALMIVVSPYAHMRATEPL